MYADVFEYKMRKNIKRALQSQVQIKVGSTPELIHDFYYIYQISNVRWGKSSPRYPVEFFLRYAENQCVEVRVAYLNYRPAACLVLLKFTGYIFGWFGGMDKELGNARANDLLHAELIKDAIHGGVKIVNFGSSGKMAGVKKFKESFGAEEQSYGIYFVGNPIAGLAVKVILRNRS